LIELQREFGNQWKLISVQLARSPISVRNRHQQLMQRRMAESFENLLEEWGEFE
jgi:hypothetical protein